LANDLEKYNLSDIIRLIDQNRADATAEQEHIYRVKG
jgi:transketolase N-terminal domain/subunit